jgi:hypothetical protein
MSESARDRSAGYAADGGHVAAQVAAQVPGAAGEVGAASQDPHPGEEQHLDDDADADAGPGGQR